MKRDVSKWAGLAACTAALALLATYAGDRADAPVEVAASAYIEPPELLVRRLSAALDAAPKRLGAPDARAAIAGLPAPADAETAAAIAAAVRAALLATAPAAPETIAAARDAASESWVAASGWRDPGIVYEPAAAAQ